jgi:D-alanyl-D-alanine carboxypeptidase/D-alanyl-D-alanine-endopeptidase (penicillin-binding protein 4)
MVPILLLLLLTPQLPGGGDAVAPPHPSAPAPAVAVAAPPVVPAILELQSDLERLIRSPGWKGDEWGVMVVSLDKGDTLFSHRPDATLAPASNLKLYTSAAALYYLGPNYRYSTYVLSSAPVEGGVLKGDLVLYGTGDPTLSDRFFASKTTVWEMFADSLAAQGITEIAGDVVGDGSYFAGRGYGEGWQESYITAWYAAPVGALSFNDNIVTVRITPGAQVGAAPSVRFVPGGEGLALQNEATTAGPGGRTALQVTRTTYDGPIVVKGQIALGSAGVWQAIPVSDPARYTAAALRETLLKRGIVVRGGVREVLEAADSPVTGRSVFAPAFDKTPPLRVLAIHQSPTLQEILTVLNHKSHNLFAEAVLRTVGRVAVGEGTVEGGERAVRYLLECETGNDSLPLAMHDGSGLSVLNRVAPRTTIRLLSYMARSPMWDDYRATLPEAGDPQGLKRMYKTRAEGNLRAKTGTIDHVSALSGYVTAANGERLAFSIMSNKVPSTWRAKRVEDAIGARLALFVRPGALPPTLAAAPPQPPQAEAEEATATSTAASPPTTPVRPAASGAQSHKIRPGDTLDGIAKRYGTTVSALQKANPGLNPKRLVPGRSVRIP